MGQTNPAAMAVAARTPTDGSPSSAPAGQVAWPDHSPDAGRDGCANQRPAGGLDQQDEKQMGGHVLMPDSCHLTPAFIPAAGSAP